MGFSLLGKKKLKEQHVAKVFVGTLNDLAEKTFPTLSEFLNEVPELMESPKIKSNQMEWFLYIVFSTNLYNLQHHFESNQLNRMRILVIDESEQGIQKSFSFITTVGLYDANEELIAVAKLSRPIEKNDEKDLTMRVRLDF